MSLLPPAAPCCPGQDTNRLGRKILLPDNRARMHREQCEHAYDKTLHKWNALEQVYISTI